MAWCSFRGGEQMITEPNEVVELEWCDVPPPEYARRVSDLEWHDDQGAACIWWRQRWVFFNAALLWMIPDLEKDLRAGAVGLRWVR